MQKDEFAHISLWLDKGLAKKFEKKAKRIGRKSKSEAMRELIRAFVEGRQGNVSQEEIEEFLALAGEVVALRQATTQIGGNLNQIARKLNETGALYAGELSRSHDELRDIFSEIQDTMGKILAKRK